MMAKIGWIDFSPTDRNRVGSVLDLLSPEGMLDELGLGTIRDSISNQLFPGISTIQTRAKYFFIIPYILREYQLLKPAQRKRKTAAKYLEEREYEIMWQLAERYHYEEGNGVIGISKRKPEKIIRRPSTIYWTGLHAYQFIDTRGLSMDYFLKQITNVYLDSLFSASSQGDDESGDDADAGYYEDVSRIKVPHKKRWSEALIMGLDKDEAEFFNDRIISLAKGKLVAELMANNRLWQIYRDARNFMDFSKVAVQVKRSGKLLLAKNLEKALTLAHDFSELMYGAHIAYNCQLQHQVFRSDCFDDDWNVWMQNIQNSMLDYQNFEPDLLLDYMSNTRPPTVQFIKEWWQQTKTRFRDLHKRDEMIQRQEAVVKGYKARLRYNKTEDAKEDKWLGIQYFDYRFNQAKTILQDIRTGLGGHNA